LRLQLGLGKPEPDALVFCNTARRSYVSERSGAMLAKACVTLGLPQVMFHALCHTHASALIAAGSTPLKSVAGWATPRDGDLEKVGAPV
jgi:hypothetical protein